MLVKALSNFEPAKLFEEKVDENVSVCIFKDFKPNGIPQIVLKVKDNMFIGSPEVFTLNGAKESLVNAANLHSKPLFDLDGFWWKSCKYPSVDNALEGAVKKLLAKAVKSTVL